MIQRQIWTDHKFQTGIDPGWAPNIMSRIMDTAQRLTYHCLQLTDDILSKKIGDSWSIKEHIGHLIDLEGLHLNRLSQFSNLAEVLDTADMSNAKTYGSDHNHRDLDFLLTKFKRHRAHFIHQFQKMDDTSLLHQALHPRLKVPMRPVDLIFFMAEHDDHHIASILDLKKRIT